MPLFSITKTSLATVDQANCEAERDLQALIEKNLGTVFGCRFVALEFPTGAQHAGRIDTLALSDGAAQRGHHSEHFAAVEIEQRDLS